MPEHEAPWCCVTMVPRSPRDLGGHSLVTRYPSDPMRPGTEQMKKERLVHMSSARIWVIPANKCKAGDWKAWAGNVSAPLISCFCLIEEALADGAHRTCPQVSNKTVIMYELFCQKGAGVIPQWVVMSHGVFKWVQNFRQ